MTLDIIAEKTITPEYHLTSFDGYTYTRVGEIYNENTEVRKSVVSPALNTYVAPTKVNLGYLTTLSNEGYPQILEEAEELVNFPGLQAYEYLRAIPMDNTIVNKYLNITLTNYRPDFLVAVKSS